MKFIILDLEWNGAFSRKTNSYFNEIIEFGAVKLDSRLQIEDTFHMVIKPVVGHKLTSLVQDLTGIADEDLLQGAPFSRAISQLRKWIGDPQAVIMTWSRTDLLVLLENCSYFLHNNRIPFMYNYADLQEYCQEKLEYTTSQQLGLTKACEMLNISLGGLEAHRALDDCILSSKVFTMLYEPEAFRNRIWVADDEFYERLTFKNSIISDIHDERVSLSEMHFHCELCDHVLRRTSEWKFYNRAFCAEFLCKQCRCQYVGRVQVKLKYEGPVTKRRLVVKPKPEETKDAADDSAHPSLQEEEYEKTETERY